MTIRLQYKDLLGAYKCFGSSLRSTQSCCTGCGLRGSVIKRGIKTGCNYARLILLKQWGISSPQYLFARGENNNHIEQIKTLPSDATSIVMQISSFSFSQKRPLTLAPLPIIKIKVWHHRSINYRFIWFILPYTVSSYDSGQPHMLKADAIWNPSD